MFGKRRLIILCAALCAFAALPLLSSARSSSSMNLSTSITIVNSSPREVRHLYFSNVNAEDWGADQLSNGTIAPGQSFTISDFACDQPQIKVIGEDQDGCFLTTVVTCGDSTTWTITSQTAADCGQ